MLAASDQPFLLQLLTNWLFNEISVFCLIIFQTVHLNVAWVIVLKIEIFQKELEILILVTQYLPLDKYYIFFYMKTHTD